jgi:hypothetical protein
MRKMILKRSFEGRYKETGLGLRSAGLGDGKTLVSCCDEGDHSHTPVSYGGG